MNDTPGSLVGVTLDEIKDFHIFTPLGIEGGPLNKIQISDIAAELCENHIDLGKSIGIRRVKIDYQVATVDWDDRYAIHEPSEACLAGVPDTNWRTLYNVPDVSSVQANTGDPVGAVPGQISNIAHNTSHVTHTFEHDEFLLVNLTFKAIISKPVPPTGLIFRGTYNPETQYAVKNSVLFQDETFFCTVAGKGFPPSDQTHWAVIADDNDDKKDQLVASASHSRPFLFFLPDGFTEGSFEILPYYRPTLRGFTVKDPKDEREFDDSLGGSLMARVNLGTFFTPAPIKTGVPVPQITFFRPDYPTANARFVIREYPSDAARIAATGFEKWDVGGLAFVNIVGNPAYYLLTGIHMDGTGIWVFNGDSYGTGLSPHFAAIGFTQLLPPPDPDTGVGYIENICRFPSGGAPPYPGSPGDWVPDNGPVIRYDFHLNAGIAGADSGTETIGGFDYDIFSAHRSSFCIQRAGLQLLTSDS